MSAMGGTATKTRSLLTAAVVAVALFSSAAAVGAAAELLKCSCSDCTPDEPVCVGEVCTKETSYDGPTGAIISERLRCTNNTFLCSLSSPFISYNCCSTHDFCNNGNNEDVDELPTTITGQGGGGENSTAVNTSDCLQEDLTRNSSNSSFEDSTSNCTQSVDDIIEEEIPEIGDTFESSGTPPLINPDEEEEEEEETFQCLEAESSNLQNFNFTFCLTMSYCFNSLRIRSNGERVFRWGCAQTCVEENRNRKKKTCCTEWFCNQVLPDDEGWLMEGEATPTWDTPTSLPTTTATADPTRPPPPVITTDNPTTDDDEEEDNSNCTLQDGGMSADIKPCAGPGSVVTTQSPITAVTPSLSPPSPSGEGPWKYFCHCTTCGGGAIICGSNDGCGTVYKFEYTFENVLKPVITRFCLNHETFQNCGIAPDLVCCRGNFCNEPYIPTPSENETTTDPITTDISTTTTPTAEPVTMTTDPTSTTPSDGTRPTSDDHDDDVVTDNPSMAVVVSVTPDVADDPDAAPSLVLPSNGDDNSSLTFYALSAVVAVLVLSLMVVLLVLILCCCCKHSKIRRERKSEILTWSPRQQIGVTTTRYNFSNSAAEAMVRRVRTSEKSPEGSEYRGHEVSEAGERGIFVGRVIDGLVAMELGSKVENSCTTESTYTQPSTPESTV